MARVVAVFDDLLLGSNVLGMLQAAGHDATLSGGADIQSEGVDLVIIDLGASTFDGVAVVESLAQGTRTLGVYSHVDVETRGELTVGETVVDTNFRSRRWPNVEIALDADERKFVAMLLETFTARAAVN